MADLSRRLDFNVAGAFYVDDQCIHCGVCIDIAPTIFGSNEDEGYAYVKAQPASDDEERLTREAMESCPVESIGDDGQ